MTRPIEHQSCTEVQDGLRRAGARPSPLTLATDSSREKREGTTDLTPVTAINPSIKKTDSGEYGSGRSSLDIPIRGVSTLTYLATFACNLVYLAQTWCLVGVGLLGIAITTQFNAAAQTSWLTTSIAICLAVLGPIFCHIADYWGRKWLLIIMGCLLGTAGALILARATNISMALVGTCLIGISFGGQPVLHAVASEVLPRRWRGWSQGFLMCFSCVGAFVALVVGGLFSQSGGPDGFRSYFYIGAALYFIAGTLLLFVYKPSPRDLQTLPLRDKLSKLDWVGYGLLMGGLVSFCVGLSYSQNPYPWSSPVVYAPFAVGLVLLVCLGLYEWQVKPDGILHHGLFQKSRNFPLTLVCLFCEGLAFMGANAYLASEVRLIMWRDGRFTTREWQLKSFQISTLFVADPVMTGINYGIAWLSAATSSVVAGAICTATKKVRSITLTGFVMFTIFFALMASASAQSRQEVWAYPVFLGLGLGVVTSTLVTTAQLSTPPDLIASATGIIIGIRALGGSVGIPIYTAVYNNQYSRGLGTVASAAIQAGLSADTAERFAQIFMQTPGNISAIASLPGVTQEIIAAGSTARLDAIALAYRYIWITGIPFMLMATTASYFIIDHKEEFNHRVDTPLPS